jgi:ribose transport system substrate-binding protein
MKKFLSMVLAILLVLSCVVVATADGMYISVISKGEQHSFWQAVRKGANDAAEKYGVDIYYYGPPSESDIALQVEAVKAEMAKNPAALCLAALSTDSVMEELQECLDKGIPVIGFDSGVPNAPKGAIYATASTNNYNAAVLAAEEIFKLEGFTDLLTAATPENPAVIAILCQDATSESITSRTTGFVDKAKELASEFGVVSVEGHDLWAMPAEGASIIIKVEVSASSSYIDVTNAANALLNTDGLIAVFCSNQGTAEGMLIATADGTDLADGARYGDLIVAGFDAGILQKNAIREGWFVGSITQDPYNIGYLAVELAYKAANGEAVSDVDTGAKWYTAANIDDPDIALLVYD